MKRVETKVEHLCGEMLAARVATVIEMHLNAGWKIESTFVIDKDVYIILSRVQK